jgi:hypothetical protein
MTNWGQIQNNKGWGTIYNQTWFGQFIFYNVVGDANDLYKRVSDDSGTFEAHTSLVITSTNSLD